MKRPFGVRLIAVIFILTSFIYCLLFFREMTDGDFLRYKKNAEIINYAAKNLMVIGIIFAAGIGLFLYKKWGRNISQGIILFSLCYYIYSIIAGGASFRMMLFRFLILIYIMVYLNFRGIKSYFS